MKTKITWMAAALALACATSPGSAQTLAQDVGRLEMTRGELNELLQHYANVAQSTGYSSETRARARTEQALIRDRLDQGDFRMGDRIVLLIEGEWVEADTLAVERGQFVNVPQIGEITLKGVLRSELQSHMIQELGRYFRNPIVRAESLIRLRVMGAVGAQGFYNFPAKMLIGEALMGAGGLAENADLEDMEIRRGEQTIWEGDTLQEAINDGSSLDQMNLRAGDELYLPEDTGNTFLSSLLRYGVVVGTAIVFGVRIF